MSALPEDSTLARTSTLVEGVVGARIADVDQDLVDAGLLDSLALVELLQAVEEEFAVEFPVEELELDVLRTVRSIAGYIDELQARNTT